MINQSVYSINTNKDPQHSDSPLPNLLSLHFVDRN